MPRRRSPLAAARPASATAPARNDAAAAAIADPRPRARSALIGAWIAMQAPATIPSSDQRTGCMYRLRCSADQGDSGVMSCGAMRASGQRRRTRRSGRFPRERLTLRLKSLCNAVGSRKSVTGRRSWASRPSMASRCIRRCRGLAREAREGKLDRREFLAMATALGVTGPAAYGLLGLAAPAARAGAGRPARRRHPDRDGGDADGRPAGLRLVAEGATRRGCSSSRWCATPPTSPSCPGCSRAGKSTTTQRSTR